jgi:hypothetical protein
MTRPGHEFELVRFYVDWGLNNSEIERLTSIPRNTVREWRRRARLGLTNSSGQKAGERACPICSSARLDEEAYAYLLGIYLGDGHIATCLKGVYRLEIVQDQRYIGLISECDLAIFSPSMNTLCTWGFNSGRDASTSTRSGNTGPVSSLSMDQVGSTNEASDSPTGNNGSSTGIPGSSSEDLSTLMDIED